jgi:hypothetical protein
LGGHRQEQQHREREVAAGNRLQQQPRVEAGSSTLGRRPPSFSAAMPAPRRASPTGRVRRRTWTVAPPRSLPPARGPGVEDLPWPWSLARWPKIARLARPGKEGTRSTMADGRRASSRACPPCAAAPRSRGEGEPGRRPCRQRAASLGRGIAAGGGVMGSGGGGGGVRWVGDRGGEWRKTCVGKWRRALGREMVLLAFRLPLPLGPKSKQIHQHALHILQFSFFLSSYRNNDALAFIFSKIYLQCLRPKW